MPHSAASDLALHFALNTEISIINDNNNNKFAEQTQKVVKVKYLIKLSQKSTTDQTNVPLHIYLPKERGNKVLAVNRLKLRVNIVSCLPHLYLPVTST